MRILLWHVHGSWTTSFVQGGHEYVLPVTADRGPDGLGRARTWDWPANVVERTPGQLAGEHLDVVLLQRRHEVELAARWTGRQPGRDLPAVYVEHDPPTSGIPAAVHHTGEHPGIVLVHVTHANELLWQRAAGDVRVIEHGVIDPGDRYTGELARAAVVVNEPVRRGRITGTDLLPGFAAAAPLDVFGMKVTGLAGHLGVHPGRLVGHEDLTQSALHLQLPRRRVYLHPYRWTSLGLALVEAMTLGLPVVALATLEVAEAVPPGAGVVSADPARLAAGLRHLLAEPEEARLAGKLARTAALGRYALGRFLTDWDRLLEEATR
jgi:glycosyltransferase involved in cell wall biosynthesis